jgi:hypothetical protein
LCPTCLTRVLQMSGPRACSLPSAVRILLLR